MKFNFSISKPGESDSMAIVTYYMEALMSPSKCYVGAQWWSLSIREPICKGH